jgi:MoaA/NifB/PqqE/SkfB family radical SAM enzyme
MIDLTKPVDASYELNNICNLMCPQCARNTIKDGVLQKNPDTSGNPLPTLDNYQMSLDDFKTSFDNIGNVGLIKFYGTVSENVASSNFHEINQYIIDNGARVLTSTNGSLRSKEWWSELGKLYSKSETSRMVFCLDGLHDALPLYRINANYDKIIENAIAFIEAGGQAEWRMIIFKHNQHQLEDAKSLAKQYGFHKFTYQYSNRMDVEPFTYNGKEV